MDERLAAVGAGRQFSGGDIFEAFDDGLRRSARTDRTGQWNTNRLSGAIVADDEGKWGEELDRLADAVVKGADAGGGERNSLE